MCQKIWINRPASTISRSPRQHTVMHSRRIWNGDTANDCCIILIQSHLQTLGLRCRPHLIANHQSSKAYVIRVIFFLGPVRHGITYVYLGNQFWGGTIQNCYLQVLFFSRRCSTCIFIPDRLTQILKFNLEC